MLSERCPFTGKVTIIIARPAVRQTAVRHNLLHTRRAGSHDRHAFLSMGLLANYCVRISELSYSGVCSQSSNAKQCERKVNVPRRHLNLRSDPATFICGLCYLLCENVCIITFRTYKSGCGFSHGYTLGWNI